MNPVNPLDIIPELSALESSLARATSTARDMPRLFAARALVDLTEANTTLTRVVRLFGITPAELDMSARFAAQVQLLGKDVKELGLSARALKACKNIHTFLLANDIPVALRSGITTVGELAQLNYKDFLKVKNCGRQTAEELRVSLERHQLSFDMHLPAMQFGNSSFPRIRSAQSSIQSGTIFELCYGEHITQEGRSILHTAIHNLSKIASQPIDIEEEGGNSTQLKTYGQLVQLVPTHLDKKTKLDIKELLTLLTPLGLSLGMQLNNEQLEELGIKRVVRVGDERKLF